MNEQPVKVWDAPVRLFHWLLVAAVVLLFVSGKVGGNLMLYHVYAGYAVLALVIFRILWGFVGSTHALFWNILAGPSRCIAFAKKLFSRDAAPSAGHNPLGGWMVLVILLALLVQAVTGLFSNDDIALEGPLSGLVSKELSDRLTGIHRQNSDVLLVLAGLHVAAVLFHWLVKKENLIAAMFTGVKRLPAGTAVQPARFASPWLALTLFVAACVAVYLIVNR
jgi:cytochrome b